MAHKYANQPKPAADETNGFVDVMQVERRPDGSVARYTEKAPVPETHEGGYTKDARGRIQNADGVILFDPTQPAMTAEERAAQDGKDEVVLEQVRPVMGDNNPIVQQILARRRARELQTRAADAKAEGRPKELDEDVDAAKRYAARKKAGP